MRWVVPPRWFDFEEAFIAWKHAALSRQGTPSGRFFFRGVPQRDDQSQQHDDERANHD